MAGFQAQAGKYINRIIQGMAVTGCVAIVVMMLWGASNAVSSWFRYGVPATVEWTEILNVIAIALPLVYVTSQKAHITIDLVIGRLYGRPKRAIYIMILFLTLFYSAFLAWQLSTQAWRSVKMWEFLSCEIPVYYWPAKVVLALGFIGMAAVTLYQIVVELRKKKTELAS